MKSIVKIVALVLIMATLPLCLASCDRSYDEAEVKAAATALIKASAQLNEIYYGKGIRYLEYSENNVSLYCEADPTHLEELGFRTVAELKAKTKEVFSTAHAESMFASTLKGTGTSQMSRYYQQYDDNKADRKPLYIMVHKEYKPLMNGEMVYDFNTLKIIDSEGEYVNATIDATVVYGEKTQTHTLNLRLIEEESGWRLACTTFAKYYDGMDKYDELQKG